MKVLLLNPPRSWANKILEAASDEARKFIHKKLVGPPLGLLTVATSVQRDHELKLVDLKGEYDLAPDPQRRQEEEPPAAIVRRLMAEHRPDVVGVTVIASEFDAAMQLLRAAKDCDPSVLTVAGGIHAALVPEHFEPHPVDVLVNGEGAQTLREVLAARADGADLASLGRRVFGIRVRDGERLRVSSASPVAREPAGRDFVRPDRSLLRRWTPTYLVGGNPRPVTYLFTSLGCPARCTFCAIWPQHKGAYYQRDPDEVVDELAGLSEYGAVRFADADTAADLGWTERLFDKILGAGIKQELVIDLRMDTAARHPRLIEKMARAGVRTAISGFESPRAAELARYHKTITPEDLHLGFQVCEANGIRLRANYVIPADYGLDDFAALTQFAAEHRAAYAGYTILTPLPGTLLHRELRAQIVDPDLSHYNFFNCVVQPRLPLEQFYAEVAKLWLVRSGTDTIS